MGECWAPSWVGDDALFRSGLKLSVLSIGGIMGGAAIVGVDIVVAVVYVVSRVVVGLRNAGWFGGDAARGKHATSSFPPSSSAYHLHATHQALQHCRPLAAPFSSFTTVVRPLLTFAMSNGLPDEVVTCLQNARFVSPLQRHSSHLHVSILEIIFNAMSHLCILLLFSICLFNSSETYAIKSCLSYPLCKHVLHLHNASLASPIRTCPVLTDLDSSILQHVRTTFLMSR